VSVKEEGIAGGAERGLSLLAAAGGVLGALAASSCCIVPLVLFGLGISGAWIGNFTRLAPYQPYFIAASLVCIGAGYWLARRTKNRSCTDDKACARPLPKRITTAALLFATIIVLAALAVDFLAPVLLNS
jgi:mercuric ion transport protein